MFNINKNDNKLLETTEVKEYKITGLIIVLSPFAVSAIFYVANGILKFL